MSNFVSFYDVILKSGKRAIINEERKKKNTWKNGLLFCYLISLN